MLRKFLLVIKNKELRTKILQVLGLLLVSRMLTYIPIPGLAVKDLSSLTDNNNLFALLNVISGGGYGTLSFVMLGVSPYITGSIVFQLLGIIIPKLNEIRKEEGNAGQQKINRWTRFLTIPLAALSGWAMLKYLAQDPTLATTLSDTIIVKGTGLDWFFMISAMIAGSMIVMWLGELISEYKVGNGVTLMIVAGIVVKLPQNVVSNWGAISSQAGSAWKLLSDGHWGYLFNWTAYSNFLTDPEWVQIRSFVVLILSFVATLFLVVFMNDAVRKIMIVYSRRGHAEGTSRLLSAVKADLPIKVNIAGVVPIIFAVSFVLFPTVVATFLRTANISSLRDTAQSVETYLSQDRNRFDNTSTQSPYIPEPTSITNEKFLFIYKPSSQANLLEAVQYDSTKGGDLLGFTINNFKTECNLADDAPQVNKDYKDKLHTKILGIDFGCGQKLSFLPEFSLHWNGVAAYYFFYFLLIIFFTYFYTANVIFKTDEVAENLQKSGAYIPGYKPGVKTQNYLSGVANKLNVVGSLFLALIALLPILLGQYIQFDQQSGLAAIVGGTTILILVSGAIESLKQIDAQITLVDYDRYLKNK
jgi:preprotein translocase subunit SecY